MNGQYGPYQRQVFGGGSIVDPFRNYYGYRNAIARDAELDKRRAMQQQRIDLAKRGVEATEKRFHADEKYRAMQMDGQALTYALSQTDPEKAKSIYQHFNPEGEVPEFLFKDLGANPHVEIRFPNGMLISGPKKQVRGVTNRVAIDPEYMTDPQKARRLVDFAAQHGISMTMPQEQKTEPFTLSPGQQRFSGQGQQVASVPAKPEQTGLTPAQQGTEDQRVRNQVSRLWGFNEFSRLDEETNQKIERSTIKAQSTSSGVAPYFLG
ncbi:hypothetical protein C6A37_07160 [Desulfobacteraceae bacterium SEEP-SAG9]|nr:hypothetical protein C6A37_07160 [Desulfobacteraceae bacterium SEEP-SAG9]